MWRFDACVGLSLSASSRLLTLSRLLFIVVVSCAGRLRLERRHGCRRVQEQAAAHRVASCGRLGDLQKATGTEEVKDAKTRIESPVCLAGSLLNLRHGVFASAPLFHCCTSLHTHADASIVFRNTHVRER